MHRFIQKASALQLQLIDSGVPIYLQIRDQILGAIGRGALQPGEQLPTMRQLAVDLKVDLNTVRHAYEELEQTGAIVILRARGTYVAEKPPAPDAATGWQRLQAMARQTMALATAAGLDPEQLAEAVLQLSREQRGLS